MLTEYKFIKILSWISSLVAVVLVVWKIFGNSPTFENLIGGLILGWLITNQKQISKLQVHQQYNAERFNRIENEIKDLRRDITGILIRIEKRLD